MGACFGRCFNIKNSKPYRSQRTMYFQGEDNIERCMWQPMRRIIKGSHSERCKTIYEQSVKVDPIILVFDFLVDELPVPPHDSRPSKGISYLFSLKRKKVPQKVTLELRDDSWPRTVQSTKDTTNKPQTSSSSTGDVMLQPLDARSLLAARAVLQTTTQREKSIASSTPPSSLDLEWEHEGCLPIQPHHYGGVAEEEHCESATTGPNGGASAANSTAWSRVSTPDSLEWDPVEAPLATASERPIEELDAETEQLLSEIERLTSRALRETGDWSS